MSTPFGQLLLLEASNADWSSGLERLLQRSKPAGVFFKSLATIPATSDVAHKCAGVLGSVPFLAIQDEGDGPLCNLFGGSLPPAHPTGARGKAVEILGNLVSRAMQVAGLNLNFAPTLDLRDDFSSNARNPRNAVQTAPLPQEVTRRTEAFLEGLTRHGVLPCARYFPGLTISGGEGSPALPVVARSMAALWREDLVPYRTLGNKLPLIQISHAVYKAYDYEFPRPASLSPSVVEGLLRLKLGYEGVALADVSAAARSAGIEVAEAALRAIEGGCDLLVIPAEQKPVAAVVDAIERASEFGKLPRERVEQALGRVQKALQGLSAHAKEPAEREVSRLAEDFQKFREHYGSFD
jgi:beta-N-acetylhexosaminidase